MNAQPFRADERGFSLTELVIVIVILGILSAVALPLYVNMTKDAEKAAVEATIGNLSSALGVWVAKQAVTGATTAGHNPFDDLAAKPDNYVGAFPDVDLANCPPGHWAFQSGSPSLNSSWAVVCYRPKATLTTAFGWSTAQWILYEVKTSANAQGTAVGAGLVEYPPLHAW